MTLQERLQAQVEEFHRLLLVSALEVMDRRQQRELRRVWERNRAASLEFARRHEASPACVANIERLWDSIRPA